MLEEMTLFAVQTLIYIFWFLIVFILVFGWIWVRQPHA